MTHEQLLDKLGPLPLTGNAWPKAIKVMAWVVLAIIGAKLIHTASSPVGQQVSPTIASSIVLLFAALIVVAYYMQHSVVTINAQGIQQTWITKRYVNWADIKSAKFIPLFASKKLVCFTGQGRPVVLNAGTKELQVAFAYIALAYGSKKT